MSNGSFMVGCGALIAGTSGLCSLGMLGTQIGSGEPYSLGEWLNMVLYILAFGGLPFVLGAGLVIAGRRQIRKDRA